jgi:hypothetical protein
MLHLTEIKVEGKVSWAELRDPSILLTGQGQKVPCNLNHEFPQVSNNFEKPHRAFM